MNEKHNTSQHLKGFDGGLQTVTKDFDSPHVADAVTDRCMVPV